MSTSPPSSPPVAIAIAVASATLNATTTTTSLATAAPSTKSVSRPLALLSDATASAMAGDVPSASADRIIAMP